MCASVWVRWLWYVARTWVVRPFVSTDDCVWRKWIDKISRVSCVCACAYIAVCVFINLSGSKTNQNVRFSSHNQKKNFCRTIDFHFLKLCEKWWISYAILLWISLHLLPNFGSGREKFRDKKKKKARASTFFPHSAIEMLSRSTHRTFHALERCLYPTAFTYIFFFIGYLFLCTKRIKTQYKTIFISVFFYSNKNTHKI